MPSAVPFPRDFICEHTSAKSRVFAVLASPGRPDTLKAVLTCTDPLLVQRAASVLASLALTGGGVMINAQAEEIHATLPTAPAASFHEACQRLWDRQWPDADASPVRLDQVQARDEDDLTPALRDEEARTPPDARLAGLTGKAFRVIQFAEYHVYDTERLLHAATAHGWSPTSAEDEEADPNDDLLDALMHMAGLDPDVPGADAICGESSGQELTADAGDELVDWQRQPVTAEFGGGSRLRTRQSALVEHLDDLQEDLDSSTPDFASLFPVRSCDRDHTDEDEEMECDVCDDWQLTPRTAYILHTALAVLSDEAYDDVKEHGSDPVTRENADDWAVFRRLPQITWRTDADWRRQFARAFEDLSGPSRWTLA